MGCPPTIQHFLGTPMYENAHINDFGESSKTLSMLWELCKGQKKRIPNQIWFIMKIKRGNAEDPTFIDDG